MSTTNENNYIETLNEAKRLKETHCHNADPILQRNPFLDKHPRTSNETKNYLSNIKEDNDRPLRKIIPQKTNNIFSENIKDNTPLPKHHKKSLAAEFEAKVHAEKKRLMQHINSQHNHTQIDTIFDSSIPVQKDRPHVKHGNNGKPSDEYIKMANRDLGKRKLNEHNMTDHIKELHDQTHQDTILYKNQKKNIQPKTSIKDLINQDNSPCPKFNYALKPTMVNPNKTFQTNTITK